MSITGPERSAVTERAEQFGVVDGLVFRRLPGQDWAHLGGIGRGRGWAGIVRLDPGEEPSLQALGPEAGSVVRLHQPGSGRVLGPYYAVGAALVRICHDVVVVLGAPHAELVASDQDLHRLAVAVEDAVDEVGPAKRLADELEVLHAVQALTRASGKTFEACAQHVVEVAVEMLSCDVGVLRDGQGRVFLAGAVPLVPSEQLAGQLDALVAQMSQGALCRQDGAETLLLPDQGVVRSLLAFELALPGGMLVVAHTVARPRGFTALCQQLGRQLVEAAGILLQTASLRSELEALLAQQSEAARTDALTGLGNRLAWEEALEVAEEQALGGDSFTVVSLDLDGLKAVNDAFGHEAGDDLLRRCAGELSRHVRDGDVAVRLGGDEFALLLSGSTEEVAGRVAALTEHLQGGLSCQDRVAASVGFAQAGLGVRLAEATRQADGNMYSAKRANRAAVPLPRVKGSGRLTRHLQH